MLGNRLLHFAVQKIKHIKAAEAGHSQAD